MRELETGMDRRGKRGDGGDTIRVVLVDDHAELRQRLRALLQQEGILVVAEAGDGTTGLEAVRLTGPDVVVMDVRMPFMDGLEATRRLRENHPGLPVVVHTGDESRVVAELAVRAGAAAVVFKGDPAGVLVDTVRRTAPPRALPPPATTPPATIPGTT